VAQEEDPLGKERNEEEYAELNAFQESNKAMAEEMELKPASWGECP
jgi:hypothetical protein